MNNDIASLVALRPEQALRYRTNEILNTFEAGLRQARRDFPITADAVPEPDPRGRPNLPGSVARARRAEMHRQLCRAVVRLHALGVTA